MVRWEIDIEEKIKYPFRCNSANITDLDASLLVLCRKISLGSGNVKRKSAFPAQQLVAIDFAL
jgi:hypothetical protein